MPTFDYQCKACKNEFEELILPGNTEPTECKECGKPVIKIIRSFPGVIYKGQGFPTNDMKISKDNRSMGAGKKV